MELWEGKRLRRCHLRAVIRPDRKVAHHIAPVDQPGFLIVSERVQACPDRGKVLVPLSVYCKRGLNGVTTDVGFGGP